MVRKRRILRLPGLYDRSGVRAVFSRAGDGAGRGRVSGAAKVIVGYPLVHIGCFEVGEIFRQMAKIMEHENVGVQEHFFSLHYERDVIAGKDLWRIDAIPIIER